MSQPRPQPRDRGFNAACSANLRKFSETHNRKENYSYATTLLFHLRIRQILGKSVIL